VCGNHTGGVKINPFFPGKFQPPHLGHVLTISRIIDKYGFVIIGITDDGEHVIKKEAINRIFKQIFKEQVICIYVEGTLVEQTSKCIPVSFDILLSGNEEVLRWAKKQGITIERVHRSQGIGFCGTDLRRLLENR